MDWTWWRRWGAERARRSRRAAAPAWRQPRQEPGSPRRGDPLQPRPRVDRCVRRCVHDGRGFVPRTDGRPMPGGQALTVAVEAGIGGIAVGIGIGAAVEFADGGDDAQAAYEGALLFGAEAGLYRGPVDVLAIRDGGGDGQDALGLTLHAPSPRRGARARGPRPCALRRSLASSFPRRPARTATAVPLEG